MPGATGRPRVLLVITLAEVGGAQSYVAALMPGLADRYEVVVAAHGEEGRFLPSASVQGFVPSLERPRRILIMVKAGPPTDAPSTAVIVARSAAVNRSRRSIGEDASTRLAR